MNYCACMTLEYPSACAGIIHRQYHIRYMCLWIRRKTATKKVGIVGGPGHMPDWLQATAPLPFRRRTPGPFFEMPARPHTPEDAEHGHPAC